MKILQVKVKPNARISAMKLQEDGSWRASIKSPPVDGKANAELIRLIAEKFGCPKHAVRIRSGSAAKLKLVEIGAF